MTTNKFEGSTQEMYDCATAGATSFEANVVKFTNFSPSYTMQWATDIRAKIAAAKALPDETTREADARLKRIELEESTEAGTAKWQHFKRLAGKVWKNAEVLKVILDEAGARHYEKAANHDWAAVESLMEAGSKAIEKYKNELLANDVMPQTFQLEFDALKDQFQTLRNEYVQIKEQEHIGGEEKVKANNAVYDMLIDMFKDGQDIFENEPEVRKQFVYDQVLAVVRGHGHTGFKGTVINEATEEPIPGVLLKSTIGDHEVVTDANGHFDIGQIAAGNWVFHVEKFGLNSQLINVTLEAGVTKTLQIVMTAVVPQPA